MSFLNKNILKGSLVLLIGFNIYNLLNLIFQFSMARLLSLAEYGILATLFSLIYLFAIPTEAIQTIITRYSSIESDKSKLKTLFNKSLKKGVVLSIISFIVFSIISIFLSPLLKINYPLLLLTGTMIFIAILSPITRGGLQGTKRFYSLSLNVIVEGIFKLLIGVALVVFASMYFSNVLGAIMGAIIGSLIALIYSFYSLKDIFKAKEKDAEVNGIYNYSKPVFFIILTIMAFFSLDIIIAKTVFSPEDAGAYSIASVLAKMIFLATQPISRAMFPITSQEANNKKKNTNSFTNAIGLILSLIAVALIGIYLFPELIILIFSGKQVPEAQNILFFLSIAISFLAIANLNLFYKLSIGKISNYMFLPVFVLFQAFILYFFSDNLITFSLAFILSSIVFLWGSNKLLN